MRLTCSLACASPGTGSRFKRETPKALQASPKVPKLASDLVDSTSRGTLSTPCIGLDTIAKVGSSDDLGAQSFPQCQQPSRGGSV